MTGLYPIPDGPKMSVPSFVGRILSWFRPYPWGSAVIFVALLIEMAWTVTVPKGVQHLIDHAIVPHDYHELELVLVLLAVGAIVVTAVGLLRDYLYARLSAAATNHLRLNLFDHLQHLSLSFHTRRSAGDIAARFSADVDAIKQTLQASISWGVIPALDVLITTVFMFLTEWRLALLAQLIWPLALAGPRLIAPRITAASYRYKQEEGRTLAEVNASVIGRAVIKGFGLEESVRVRFIARLASLRKANMRSMFLSALLERSASGAILILQVAVLGVGGTLAYRGSLTVGALVAFQSLFLSMSAALFYLAQFVPTMSGSAASLRRIDEILEETSTIPEPIHPVPLAPLADAITVEGVSFSHDVDTITLDGITLTIRRGESVAFVGPSGSGKSTLLGLLLRFYDPDAGAVRFDGIDLRAASRADLVRHHAVVFQDSFLFNASLRDNIRFGRLGATDADVEAAARDAEIHDHIMTLPRGYDTPAGEGGGTLSGGQRQRIAIARALVRDPSVLYLDEATSSLDPAGESSIRETIARVSRGRTVVAVTHRLSSVVDLDRVFVLDRGRLVGAGTHRTLLAEGGLYASLWRKQSGLQVSEDGTQAAITTQRLRAIPLLSSLDDAMLERLANERLVSESVPVGRDVVIEGDPGDKFYIVVRGSVAVTRTTDGGEPRRLALLQDGDHFGEIALLKNVPRTATVTTLSDTTMLSLQRGHFTALLDQAPGLRDALETELMAREREWSTI